MTIYTLESYSGCMSNEQQEVETVLTPEQVEAIRDAARRPDAELGRIARKYGIDAGHVRYIRDRGSR